MQLRIAACFIFIFTIIYGCGDRASEKVYLEDDMEYSSAERLMPGRQQAMRSEFSTSEAGTDLDIPKTEKKIIKNGNIRLKVDDLEQARNRVDTLLAFHDGYYSNENFNEFDHEAVHNLTARIPAPVFEKFIEGIEQSGFRVVEKNISARDVTEEFIDLEMRLSNRRKYLDRYNELLKQAQTVKDIIDIEENTRKLEEEIESAEGRLKYLTGQVDYSTLYITLTMEKDYTFQPGRRGGFFERLKQSVTRGWYGLVDFLLFIIRIWPFWIILTLMIILFRKIVTRSKRKS